ncbi:hypothetical protein G4Z16_18175 [Streptomyces bathyalis]|uniref:DUF8175 domain-containing protein n=1 Tax=Streptomyces bathyalis TaxID=2710756 RepID=A0A7T1WTB2_9ACTN|nr:hypothetical protein [Streptomyces bathyalis]QPP08007.1 hypothetical protein G4Z16_18175 [Streptomyces bathyalis]
MSIGGEGYGERDRTGDEGTAGGFGRGPAGLTTTRTRLPGSEGGGRPPARPGRSIVTIVGVVVLLIAAIAFANQSGGGGGDDSSAKEGSEAQPTAPTGQKPVKGGKGGIASGFPQSQQGAESAAANYAVALGGDGMFSKDSRHQIVEAVSAPGSLKQLQKGFDADYSDELNKKIGIDDEGKAPAGSTFVNRTMPAGTTVRSFDSDAATVAVWCSGLFGVAGEDSTKPVKNSWFTVTFKLKWTDGDWKVVDSTQKDGPTPVNGDSPISGAEEISKAVDEFGGFTYAR